MLAYLLDSLSISASYIFFFHFIRTSAPGNSSAPFSAADAGITPTELSSSQRTSTNDIVTKTGW